MFDQAVHLGSGSERLRNLAAFLHRDGSDLAQSQLEERLRPIVRLALRRGEGIPEVVGWVRRAQANLVGTASRPDQGAAEIARMLSATLMQAEAARPRPSAPRHADTVVGI